MKKLLLLAAFLPLLGEAAEKEDTTFVVKDKKNRSRRGWQQDQRQGVRQRRS